MSEHDKEGERPGSWRELIMKTVELGVGALYLTKETGQKLVGELEERGHITKQEAKETLDRLVETGREQKRNLEDLIGKVVDRALEKADVARSSDIKALEARIAELEARLGGGAPESGDPSEASCD